MDTLRWVRGLGVGSVVTLAVAAHGCGVTSAGDCTDKATCGDSGLSPSTDDAGIDGVGTSDGPGGETSLVDGTNDDVGQSCDGCSVSAPAGWSLVAFATSRAVPCPTGFTPTDVIENPASTPATCTCGSCSITTAPDCKAVTISTMWDSGPATCTYQGDYYQGNVTCGVLGGSFGLDITAIPPPPKPGLCTAPSKADPTTVVAVDGRICVPTVACSACSAATGPTFATCLASGGDQSCPASAPNKHLVGTGPAVSCSTCGCGVTATCTGTLSFFKSGDCSGSSFFQLATDGACHNANNQMVGSYTWSGSVVNPQCTSGTSAANVALNGEQTICCP